MAEGRITEGAEVMAPKYVAIDVATLGDNVLVAGITGVKFRIISLFIVASGGANTVILKSNVNHTGGMSLLANQALVLPDCPSGWIECTVGQAFQINLSAATSVDGACTYIEDRS